MIWNDDADKRERASPSIEAFASVCCLGKDANWRMWFYHQLAYIVEEAHEGYTASDVNEICLDLMDEGLRSVGLPRLVREEE